MNKIKMIIIVFVFIIIVCIVGAFFVQADTEIKSEDDVLEVQNKITNSISAYGYAIDNPNVIVDPYNVNYNSALIMFETDEYVSISVNVNDLYSYNSGVSNKHYIGVYDLLDGNNYVVLSYGDNSSVIEINVDENGDIFDLNGGILLSNNHLLVSTNEYVDNDIYTGIREVDALGKIYYEYLLEEGYKGIACEIDESRLAILSDSLIILDRQNGNIIDSFNISDNNDNWIAMDYVDESIVLYGNDKNVAVDMEGDISFVEGVYNKKYFSGDVNYLNNDGIRFGKNVITNTCNKNILLFSYSKDIENKMDIKKEFNRLVVSSEDISGCNTYLILDKLFDKRVYELCNSVNYIYTSDLDGKYSVYFKINDDLYKTDKYLDF